MKKPSPPSLKGLKPQEHGARAERPVRVAVQLRQEVSRLLLRELAKIFFRIATTAEGTALELRRTEAQTALDRASGRVRKAVTARLGLRVAPELRFQYDEGQDARDRIEQLLDEVKRGL